MSTDNRDLAEQLAQETDTRKNLEVVKNRLEKQKMDLENEVSKLDATMKSKVNLVWLLSVPFWSKDHVPLQNKIIEPLSDEILARISF